MFFHFIHSPVLILLFFVMFIGGRIKGILQLVDNHCYFLQVFLQRFRLSFSFPESEVEVLSNHNWVGCLILILRALCLFLQ